MSKKFELSEEDINLIRVKGNSSENLYLVKYEACVHGDPFPTILSKVISCGSSATGSELENDLIKALRIELMDTDEEFCYLISYSKL